VRRISRVLSVYLVPGYFERKRERVFKKTKSFPIIRSCCAETDNIDQEVVCILINLSI
jgi:hypothetical protein